MDLALWRHEVPLMMSPLFAIPHRRCLPTMLIAFLALLLAARVGLTQPAPSDPPAPSVDTLVSEAIQRHPSVFALQHRVGAASEEVAPSGALPDPMLGGMYQSVGMPWGPMTLMSMWQVEYSQPLPYPGKREARQRSARSEVRVQAARLPLLRAQLASEVRQVFARIFALDRERESVIAAQDLVRTLAEAVSGRYAAGQAEQEAVAKLTLERFRLSERLSDLVADRAGLVAQLNQLAGREVTAPFGLVPALPTDLPLPANPSAASQAHAPELQAQQAEVLAARERLHAAGLETKPNFVVGLAAGSTLSAEPIVVARFGAELPLWSGSKQEPMARAAQHRLDASLADLSAAQRQVQTSIAQLQARWTRDNDQIVRYEQAILPQTSTAMQAAIAAYVAGRGDFSNLIEDLRIWLEARVSLAQRQADRYITWSEFQALTASASP